MSANLADFAPWPAMSGIVGIVYCDTAADLPAVNAFSQGNLVQGSKAKDIDTGDEYMMNSSGTWIKQPAPNTTQLSLTDYYTSAEVDAAINTALSSYAQKSDVIPEAEKRGTLIISTVADKFDILSITTPGKYYTTTASGTYTLVNSPLEAYGINKDTGACVIGGQSVSSFNATAEILVEEVGASSLGALQYTVRYAYNSASTGAGPTAGRNLARTKYWTLIKDAYSVTQWVEHEGTAI